MGNRDLFLILSGGNKECGKGGETGIELKPDRDGAQGYQKNRRAARHKVMLQEKKRGTPGQNRTRILVPNRLLVEPDHFSST
jgi:hypothetical protein